MAASITTGQRPPSKRRTRKFVAMYKQSSLAFCLLVGQLCGGSAGFWPFSSFASADTNAKQVAIIGAGAAGSSTAFHLHKYAEEAGIAINITVFERSSYIGGRSTTINVFEDPLEPVELGASIFVEVNRILKDAANEFGLHTQPHVLEGDEPEVLGIWNGEKFVFTQKDGGWAWWDTAKLLWKYGLAPIRTQRLVRATVAKFLKLYEPPSFPFRSLSARALDLDLVLVTAVTGQQLLEQNKIGPPFTTDIIQASTRVNYGQNLGIIHGLETMVCMSIEGAMQVEGGNWQIFDNMVKAANAKVLLNTTVTNIMKKKGSYVVQSGPSQQETTGIPIVADMTFDAVVLAAPLQFSGIKLAKDSFQLIPDEIPYVRLHVTLFTTPLRLSRAHFNLRDGAELPTTVLTTLSPEEDPSSRKNIAGKSGFFSISTLKSITNPKTSRKEYVYKIFSPEKVTEQFLSKLFDIKLTADKSIFNTSADGPVSWYYPHVWHSYPYEYPRLTFEDTELAPGFYYTAGIESFISTMETSALMGKNVARLIMDDFGGLVATKKLEKSIESINHGSPEEL